MSEITHNKFKTLFISLPMYGKSKKEIEQRLLDILELQSILLVPNSDGMKMRSGGSLQLTTR